MDKVFEQRRAESAAATLGEEPATTSPGAIKRSLAAIAPLMWASDYKPLIAMERSELFQMGLLSSSLELKGTAPPSTYTQRGLIRNPKKKIDMINHQAAYMASCALRQSNQQCYPFTVCARSGAKIARQTRTKDWKDSTAQRQTLDKKTSNKLIELMMKCKPEAGFEPSQTVAFHIFDQNYKKKGAARGKHRAAEHVDASGASLRVANLWISQAFATR